MFNVAKTTCGIDKSIELLAIFNVIIEKLNQLKMPDLVLVYFWCLVNSVNDSNMCNKMCDYTRFLYDHFSVKIHDLIKVRELGDTCYYVLSMYEMYARVYVRLFHNVGRVSGSCGRGV